VEKASGAFGGAPNADDGSIGSAAGRGSRPTDSGPSDTRGQ